MEEEEEKQVEDEEGNDKEKWVKKRKGGRGVGGRREGVVGRRGRVGGKE